MSLMRAYVRVKYEIYLDTSSDEEEKALLMFTQLYLDERMCIIRQPIPREVQTRSVSNRDRVWHDAKMMNDYFTPGTVDPKWQQRPDATGTMGHSPHMKLVAMMKCLCKSTATDSVDDYIRMGATTMHYYLKRFCHTICMTFGERYLREPTPEDVQRLLAENIERWFPGMLGSMQCPWKNCLIAWQGTYRGKEKHSYMVLEAVTSYDLWFWHVFFGMHGSNNDLNMLAHSLLFDNMIKGVAPPCNYVINGHQYNMGCFLSDGIYPKLTTIVQSFSQTLDIPDYVRFNKYQIDKRKYVERDFGVLQGKFRIV
ncbi:uncharacterized protein LOC113305986 [Papaver somniferum]|uniref:uncharacterized protein LOC113305986 n=1 Tax=Papaver somniferum TaxID=3469 RepID=UPI000E702B27|nr:uncharacterized protein LOC113305986 [Papaver somniferum]